MNEKPTQPLKFTPGRIAVTRGAAGGVHSVDVQCALLRHLQGEWGEVGPEDWEENELSLREGFRLLSVYRDRAGVTFWIITEADRSAATVLLPDEY